MIHDFNTSGYQQNAKNTLALDVSYFGNKPYNTVTDYVCLIYVVVLYIRAQLDHKSFCRLIPGSVAKLKGKVNSTICLCFG